MRTIAVLNQKGGVGKTTTVVNTAAALAAFGAKVLAIDFDPQAHLTIHLGVEPQSIDSGSYNVLTQSASLESEIMMVRDNLWLLPANIDLVGAESELVSVVGREIILREAIEQCHQEFDYCLIDCAPSLGLLTLNALAAAQEVLIPLQPHFLALQGFGKLLQTVEIVNRRINPSLRVSGILLCMFDSRASLPNEVKADIERFLNDARGTNSAWSEAHVLPVLVRRNIKLAEAPSYGKTIFEYENSCNGAQDYQKVAEFIHGKAKDQQEPSEPVNIQQNTEQLESFQSEIQPENTEQAQEVETQINDVQDNYVETETEVSQDEVVSEPEEYYTLSEESEPSNDLQDQQQMPDEGQQTQPEFQSENSEQIQEVVSESSDIQNNLNEVKPEVQQSYTNPGQIGYVIPKFEQLQKNGFRKYQQVPQEEQPNPLEIEPVNSEQIQNNSPENKDVQENQNLPEQFDNQQDSSNEIPKKPPFEIREIQSHSSPEPEQYIQIPEESNQPEQNKDNYHSENQGY